MATMIMLMLRSLILMLMVPTRCLAPLAAPPLPPGLSTCPRWTFLIILHRSKYISSLTSQSLIDHLSLLLLMQQGQRWPSDHEGDIQLTIPFVSQLTNVLCSPYQPLSSIQFPRCSTSPTSTSSSVTKKERLQPAENIPSAVFRDWG